MAQFKTESVNWEIDNREVLIDGCLNDKTGEDNLEVSSLITFEPGFDVAELPRSGVEDRPHTPQPPEIVEDPRLYLHELTWGFDVIKSLDNDDPDGLIMGLLRNGADPNLQVDRFGLGGYKWSAWAHRLTGDTVLHLALRWRKIKALAGLYPLALSNSSQNNMNSIIESRNGNEEGDLTGFFDISIRDAHGFTANELCLRDLNISIVDLWRKTETETLRAAEQARLLDLKQKADALKASHMELYQKHQKAGEEYRVAVRQIGASIEGDVMITHRRILSLANAAETIDQDGRLEARKNIWLSSGMKPRSELTMPQKPCILQDQFPIDITEVENQTLRQVLTTMRDRRIKLERIRTNYELKYGGAIGPQGAFHLGQCLPATKFLTHLCLANQRVGVKGAVHLARGLKGNSSIRFLDLSSNVLEDKGTLCIVVAIKKKNQLETILLDANRIKGSEALLAFSSILSKWIDRKRACNLKLISLTNNMLSNDDLNQLHDVVMRWNFEKQNKLKVYPQYSSDQ